MLDSWALLALPATARTRKCAESVSACDQGDGFRVFDSLSPLAVQDLFAGGRNVFNRVMVLRRNHRIAAAETYLNAAACGRRCSDGRL